jgi:hypothetical protein
MVSSDLNDAVEVGATELRGGAGGPVPLGRRRRQHHHRCHLLWWTWLLVLLSRDLPELQPRALLRWIALAPVSPALIWCGDGSYQPWWGTQDQRWQWEEEGWVGVG